MLKINEIYLDPPFLFKLNVFDIKIIISSSSVGLEARRVKVPYWIRCKRHVWYRWVGFLTSQVRGQACQSWTRATFEIAHKEERGLDCTWRRKHIQDSSSIWCIP